MIKVVRSEYGIWQKMKSRCLNSTDKAYPKYGGRGIFICNEWVNSFESFFNHVGERPSMLHSIDRINNDGGYEPNNVRWATRKEQANNTRKNRIIEYLGVKYTLSQLSEKLNIAPATVLLRLTKGSLDEDGRHRKIGKTVLDLQTGVFYESAHEAAAAKNIQVGYLRYQLGGHCKNVSSMTYV